MKFPTFEGVNSTYKMESDNADIRKAIVKAVPKATEQVKEMANSFSGANDQETCKKIFDFLKNRINYEADGTDQIIRYPSALLKTRKGDCKSYSLLTAAILNNLEISCRFVLQSFNDDPTPSHIYVETLSGVKCDAVWGKFNSEKPSTYKYYIPMNVKYMSGINGVKTMGNSDCASCNTAIGSVKIGLTAKDKADCDRKHPVIKTWFGDTNRLSRQGCYTSKAIKEKAKQAKNWVDELNLKKYFGSLPRQITLGIYSMNIDGLASNVNNTPAKAKLLDEWIRLGGDPKALNRAITDGSSKRPVKIGFRGAIERKIKEILNKNKVISGVNNAKTREQAKKLLMEPNPVSDAYVTTLVSLGSTFGATIGGTVGSILPAVGNAAGAAIGTGMGGSLGYFAFAQTPSLIDAIFPVDGNSGSDPNIGDPEWTFPTDGGETISAGGGKTIPAEPNNTQKAGFGNAVLPILIGVGVIMALNTRKK